MKTTIEKHFYRNGRVRERASVRNGVRHGVVRIWHKNGVLASEEQYRDGFLHGTCRQWSARGTLLGEYTIVHGNGVQRSWYDNGVLQSEIATVNGEFCGRNRLWLRDGALLSERFYLFGRVVTAKQYHSAAENDPTLPKYPSRPGKPLPKNRRTERRIHRVFISGLIGQGVEVREWLKNGRSQKEGRSLGRFELGDATECEAGKFINELYLAGAEAVLVPDIYKGRDGTQFADALIVRLPKSPNKRRKVRWACAQLKTRGLGAIEPAKDIGEEYLYLSLY